MKKKIINTTEEYLLQVLSMNKDLSREGSSMGKYIIEVDDDGKPKFNDENLIIITGTIPDALLFRGQGSNFPLIPKIARGKKDVYFERIENRLIQEIKRRGDKITTKHLDDWELLVYVQHYGLATRLLDWTTNPLTALWFACQSAQEKKSAFVYMLRYNDNDLLDTTIEKSPFSITKTKVFKPNLNNERVIAQNGWFTVHSLNNKDGKFIPLEEESEFKDYIMEIEIPAKKQDEIIGKLDILGTNSESIFPGIEGACRYVNWKNEY